MRRDATIHRYDAMGAKANVVESSLGQSLRNRGISRTSPPHSKLPARRLCLHECERGVWRRAHDGARSRGREIK